MSDTISRQAALDALEKSGYCYHFWIDIENIINSLPSAEQATGKLNNPDDSLLTADSEACKEQKSKLDLISRQDAINAIPQTSVDAFENCRNCELLDREQVIEILESLPSAPDSRQRGEWVWDEDAVDWGIGAWCCSECLCRAQTWWSTDRNKNPLICAGSRFCGNCGADMRGDSE